MTNLRITGRRRLRLPVPGAVARIGAAAAVALSAGSASATWSILLVDLSTGEIAVGSATCLTGFDLQANTPVLIPGVGAATAQSFVDTNGLNRTYIRDALVDGSTPSGIVAALDSFDAGHQSRQYGIVRIDGEAATFTGTGAGGWAGGVTGVLSGAGVTGGDIAYAIQGNVLTGEVVVVGALDAVAASEGDLAAKLLAGMTAARDLGGDGRCSCATFAPESCGPTPDEFEKSADIAYILVARRTDREGCSPTYRLDGVASGLATLPGGAIVATYENLPRLDVIATDAAAVPGRVRGRASVDLPLPAGGVLTAELTGDGSADAVAFAGDGSAAWLLPGTGEGLDLPVALPVGGTAGAAAELGADGRLGLVVLDPAGPAVHLLTNGAGGFELIQTVPVPDAPTAVAARDLDGDGRSELAVVSSDGASLTVLGFDGSAYAVRAAAPIAVVREPSIVVIADVAGTGSPQIFVGGLRDNELELFAGDGTPAAQTIIPLPGAARTMNVMTDGEGSERLLVIGAIGSAIVQPLFPGAPLLIAQGDFAFRPTPSRSVLVDLDGDGDGDLVAASPVGPMLRLAEQRDDVFPMREGCGNGEFYLEFNIAFSTRTDPDPVDQLEERFAGWADDLAGVPDAVRSTAETVTALPRSIEGCETLVRVRTVDRAGSIASAQSLEAEIAQPGRAGVEIVRVDALGGGVFDVTLRANGEPATTDLAFTAVADGTRIELASTLAVVTRDPADINGDGRRTPTDFDAWVNAYAAGEPAAEQNGDGLLSPADFFAFVVNYAGGCG